jgi:protein tyrosine phosphatase
MEPAVYKKTLESDYNRVYNIPNPTPTGNEARNNPRYSVALANADKNRYPNILPYNESRVILYSTDNNPDGYINASYYKEKYILTQGPLPADEDSVGTIADFWRMAFEENADIVCLTELKTADYWVTQVNDERYTIYESFSFYVKPLEEPTIKLSGAVTESEFKVKINNIKKVVKRISFLNWPDFGICNVDDLLKFRKLLPENTKQIVHCSAGVGRSGVYVVIDILINEFDKSGKIPTEDDIDLEIAKLREVRAGAVQTEPQRRLISETVFTHIERTLNPESQ